MSKKILVVDDNKTYLTFACHALKSVGFKVVQAEDIWISRIVKAEEPDLILMDVSLGSSNGTCAVSAIKKWSLSNKFKIYLHSSETAETLAELSVQCGADGFIVKDGSDSSLVKAVSRALSHQSTGLNV